MDKELLKIAQDGLHILDVALRASRVALSDKFDPKYQEVPRNIQLMQRTVRSETVEVVDDGHPDHLFRVFVKLGIRWIRSSRETEPSPAKEVEDADQKGQGDVDVLAVIEATFVAEYKMSKEVGQPALDEFALHNAPWHIWPYWREYVANQCARLNIPKATMPMQYLAPKQDAPENNSSS